MRGLRSWTGVVLAALYALAFLALYVDYLMRAGTWFADLPLALAALPFTLVMRALSGGEYAFGGDMSGRVFRRLVLRRARLSRRPHSGGLRSRSREIGFGARALRPWKAPALTVPASA
jgi:hypothetical protein